MAQIKSDDKLVVEQFPDQRDWIEPMFRVLNNFMAQVGGALKGALTFADNMLGEERLFDFVYQSDALSLPQRFKWTLLRPPKELRVISATVNNAPFICVHAWEFTDSGLVQLTEIAAITAAGGVTALTAGDRYRIKVRVTP